MAEHTKGPWTFTSGHDEYASYVRVWAPAKTRSSGEKLVAELEHGENISLPEAEANARLIAAAPAFLDSAKELRRLELVILSAVNYADRGHLEAVSAALKANRAAIAKSSPLLSGGE
jgi:hypothetical protein